MKQHEFGDPVVKSEGAKVVFDPGQKVIVVVGPQCWGSGDSMQQAVSKARRCFPTYGEKRFMPYNAYEASPDFEVDEMGYITAIKLRKIREVRYEGNMQIAHDLINGWILRERK